ncbi:MAG: NHLP leader peptide family RiPP precursor [Peptococcaceae bacterium]|nr:NHLP leader peptide family RiPP precursor [Peptococcaceae bacterium]
MSENEKTPTTRKDLGAQIIKKAQSDGEFKKALTANPKEALGRLGVQVPAEVEVKVVEESPEVLYLVLPADPGELADEQLDRIAGGRKDTNPRGYLYICDIVFGFLGCTLVTCGCY